MLETIIDVFEEIDWEYELDSEEQTVLLNYDDTDVGSWTCYAVVREKQQQCLFYSECPIEIPEERWLAVAEFLMLANFGMPIGNFEMDSDNGKVRFKTGIDVEGDRLSAALFKAIVRANLTMMSQYLPGIVEVALEDSSPSDAIYEVE
ncbi:MAG: YbjN domain-containing protein [Cyanobacteria bacterium J06633_8]